MANSFLSRDELRQKGFRRVGDNVLLSRYATIYSSESIEIGDNVRIDDFCILSGTISIGDYIHIAAYSALFGGDKGITIHDFANISSRNVIYAVNDDYTGIAMTNPMIPDKYRHVTSAEVIIEKHVIIGSGCVVLPGVTLREGSAFGALTLIKNDSEPWSINAGIPSRKIGNRQKNPLELEKVFLGEQP